MAGRLTDHERQAVIDALASGRSCRQIATDLKRSPSTVSAIARDVGHVFAADAPANAIRCRKAYSAERRALLGTRLLEQAEAIVSRLQSAKMDRVDARATCDYARAIGELIRSEAALRRHDPKDEDRSWFGQFLAYMKDGGSLSMGADSGMTPT